MIRVLLVTFSVLVGVSALASSPHYRHSVEFAEDGRGGNFPRPGLLPDVTDGPHEKVYGYLAYWDDDLNTVPWDDLTGVALFSANSDSAGTLTNTSRWDLAEEAVSIAELYGVRVHLCITNFSSSSIEAFLSSSSARQSLIDELESWVDQTGADGVNIDFEGLPYSVKDEMVEFTKDLEAAVGDVVLATPAVDWDGSWDFDQLNLYADMFIMGYDYHYGGSSEAGPVDPLYGGDPWNKYALDWTVADYLQWGANPDRVILGLPLYGKKWPVNSNSIPAAATGDGSSVLYAESQAEAAQYGMSWEENSETPYWYDGSHQGWYANQESLELRIQYALAEGLGGIGFWALNYDQEDEDLWAMIRAETTEESTGGEPGDPPDAGEIRADAGQPLLAYVGDTVSLNGSGSVAGDGGDLSYSWTQLQGPSVNLAEAGSAAPVFTVEAVGTHSFELSVASDDGLTAADRAYVVVLDPAAGRRFGGGCGCQLVDLGAAWLGLFPMAALAFRRRERVARG